MGLLDKAKEAAKTVGGKAQETVKAGQDKLEDQKLKKRVGELKEELGGVVYLQRIGTPPDDAEAEITRLVEEIGAGERQLAEE